MDGNQPHQQLSPNFDSEFGAGQLVGMLVILTFIEQHEGITAEGLRNLKNITASQLEGFFDKPSEDIHLLIDNLVKEINPL